MDSLVQLLFLQLAGTWTQKLFYVSSLLVRGKETGEAVLTKALGPQTLTMGRALHLGEEALCTLQWT